MSWKTNNLLHSTNFRSTYKTALWGKFNQESIKGEDACLIREQIEEVIACLLKISPCQHVHATLLFSCISKCLEVLIKVIKRQELLPNRLFIFYQHHNNNKGQAHENPTSCFFINHNPFLANIDDTWGGGVS